MSEIIGTIAETFSMLFAMGLFLHTFYMLGKYSVFDKRVRLSKLFPQLYDLEGHMKSIEEHERERIRRLLQQSLDLDQ